MTTLLVGLVLLVLLLGAVGFGVGVMELILWLVLVLGWVALWARSRRAAPRQ